MIRPTMPATNRTNRPTQPRPATRTVACPTCGGPSIYDSSNAWRPFCSQRCRQIDLGAWAHEDFRLPGENPPTAVPGQGDA